jgi:predicted peptidase
MIRIQIVFLFVLLLLCGDTMADGFSSRGNEETSGNPDYKYLLYLPKDYQRTSKKYPIIFYLHGSSQKGEDLSRLKAYGPPYAIENGRNFECIIVSPQCPGNVPLWSSEKWFETLFTKIRTTYRIDDKKVYLTGVSMGGGGAFELAKQYPDIFAAIVPLCAWQSSEKDICKINSVPVWTLHGADDNVVPIEETEQKAAALTKCKGNLRFTRLDHEGHGIHWLYDRTDTYNIYEWMLSHSKK